MIEAMIFDLDGTLVQTEKLKAQSYASAAIELCPEKLTEAEVIEAFKDVVGRSRKTVALTLVEQFNLTEQANARRAEFGVQTAWQAFVQVRLQHYEAMLADPNVLLNNRWEHNIELLEMAREKLCKVGLATMSSCEQAQRVLAVLGLTDRFDIVATRDDVEYGKPNPEIYLMEAEQLNVLPENTLVIEDSPSGVKAAVDAGMHCIAVATPFTRKQLHEGGLLEARWIVDDPTKLKKVVQEMFSEAFG